MVQVGSNTRSGRRIGSWNIIHTYSSGRWISVVIRPSGDSPSAAFFIDHDDRPTIIIFPRRDDASHNAKEG